MEKALDRREVTFAQAEGWEPLPTQLQPKNLTDKLRAELWRVIFHFLEQSSVYMQYDGDVLTGFWEKSLRAWHVEKDYRPVDEYDNSLSANVAKSKAIIFSGSYISVFDFVQFLIRRQGCPSNFIEAVDFVLKQNRAAYRVIERTVMPIANEEEVAAISENFAIVSNSPFKAARSHLQSAATELSEGNFSGCVRESIHAVESAAKQLEPSASTLGPALKMLESRGSIHGGLKEAFLRLYGYTSDEEGVRHALVFKDEAAVDETDAIFMFSSCTAFVGYLTRKTA